MAINQKTLWLATKNKGKVGEFERLLSGYWHVRSLAELHEIKQIEETGSTYEENAQLKALAWACSLQNEYVLADDSGIEVDFLNGAPGIYSARYAGERATDAMNNEKLLQKLSHLEEAKDRCARFRAVIVLVFGNKTLFVAEGVCEGTIAFENRGTNGFGYDSIFIPSGFNQTFGELPSSVKDKLSHRGMAVQKMAQFLKEYVSV